MINKKTQKILPIQWSLTNHIVIDYLISLGAGICFEAARYLKLHYNMQPVHMLISSATAPQVSTEAHIYDYKNIGEES